MMNCPAWLDRAGFFTSFCVDFATFPATLIQMRNFAGKSLALLTAAILFAAPVHAQQMPEPDVPELEDPGEDIITPDVEGTSEDDDVSSANKREATTLDSLLADLKRQPDSAAAKRISQRVWRIWADSGSDTINLLMDRAGKSMTAKMNNVALDLLDQVVRLKPGYAEGWNRRATMHFQRRDFGRALADIEQTLKLDPRHYGAISGFAVIMEQLGHKDRALELWHRVLEIYPANEQAQKKVIDLEEELAGEPA